jgi:hypothetical protein
LGRGPWDRIGRREEKKEIRKKFKKTTVGLDHVTFRKMIFVLTTEPRNVMHSRKI